MHTRDALLLLSIGSSLAGCDSPDALGTDASGLRATEYALEEAKEKYFKGGGSCPTYRCGLNSPFIGHEANTKGIPNEAGVRFVSAHHLTYGPVEIEVRGDKLVAITSEGEVAGHELVGLTLELEGEIDGAVVPLNLKLVEAALVDMWASGPASDEPLAPSYKFVYDSPGVDPQLLCPSPTEGAPDDPDQILLAKQQVTLFDAGDINGLQLLNEGLYGTRRPHHAVLFTGERFDFETAEILSTGEADWFNWGCAGSSAAKLHLTGHSAASSAHIGGPVLHVDQRQAALYAFTATYCPGAPQFTVPGQPIRLADERTALNRDGEVSFHPRAAGTVEALWGSSGALCLSAPRLEADEPSVWDEIASFCELEPCEDRGAIMADDLAGTLLTPDRPIISFNLAPDSCQGLCGESCAAAGTCCSADYVDVCGAP